MIKQLIIRNFLSHKNSKIEFSPGVNVIVGETDTGKSAIIRALKWLIFNRPSGDSVRSWWGGTTSVKVTTDEGTVTRVKSEKDNKYRIDKTQLKAVKTGVPEEVQKVLMLNKHNLQNQIDSHFLISNTPADVAKHFNTIAHLNKIDIGLANTQKWVRNTNASMKAEQDAIARLEGQLEEYKDIDTIEDKIEHLETLNEALKVTEKNRSKLKANIAHFNLCSRRIEDYKDMMDMAPKVKLIVGYVDTEDRLERDMEKLSRIVYKYNKANKEINDNKNIIAAEEFVKKAIRHYDAFSLMKIEHTKLRAKVKYIGMVDKELKILSKELDKLEKQFHKEVGEVCPICGNKIE